MNQGINGGLLAAIAIAITMTLIVLIAILVRRASVKELPVDRAQLDALQKEWRGPADLISKATPRDVVYTGKARALFAMVGVLIAASVVGAILLYPGVQRDLEQARLIQQEGVASQGTVIDHSIRRGKSDSYSVMYSYDVEGHRYQSRARVSGRYYKQLDIGSATPIHYAASHPELSHVDAALNDPPMLRMFILVPGLVLLLIPAMARREKNLLSLGTPAGAIVNRVSPTKGGQAIRFSYLDSAGTVITGQDTVPSSRAPKVGDVIPIVIDPEQPRRHKMYPFALARLDDGA